ncbi:MAG: AlpA family transcriptional regulator [Rickettsiales bacterium]|nr:AlpA family transcriptional regulator [Rickettsiales bacterium]
MTQRIIRLPEVKARTGLSRSTIYRYIDAGAFPRPVSLGARAIGWFEGQVDEWIESRATTSIPATKLERNHG